MLGYTSLPLEPALLGEQWRGLWRERLEHSGFWLGHWLAHQWRDAYWKYGFVAETFAAIECPVFAVNDWADGDTNEVFRLMRELKAPHHGLIGRWGHHYPHLGLPDSSIGFLQECLRWRDTWLKGQDTRILNEPMLRVWMQDSVPPLHAYGARPGRWVGESCWPSPNIEQQHYHWIPGRLAVRSRPAAEKALSIQSSLSVCLFAGPWCSFSATPDLPHDQRQEDGDALVFDRALLAKSMEILGTPSLDVDVSANGAMAILAVRLSDMAPDDKVTRVTYGLLNLTHHDSDEHPTSLMPGARYRVSIRLNYIAHAFPKHHRLRTAISTSYWLIARPPPESARLTIYTGGSILALPVRPPRPDDSLITFPKAKSAPPAATTTIAPRDYEWNVSLDLAQDTAMLEVVKDEDAFRIENTRLEGYRKSLERYTYHSDDFDTVCGEISSTLSLKRDDWSITTIIHTALRSTATEFRRHAELDGYEGECCVFSRSCDKTIPRDLV